MGGYCKDIIFVGGVRKEVLEKMSPVAKARSNTCPKRCQWARIEYSELESGKLGFPGENSDRATGGTRVKHAATTSFAGNDPREPAKGHNQLLRFASTMENEKASSGKKISPIVKVHVLSF